jgi:hypothetical protein
MCARSQAANRWCLAIASSVEVPRQEGLRPSRPASSVSGQSRVQKRMGPMSLRAGSVSNWLGSSRVPQRGQCRTAPSGRSYDTEPTRYPI